MRIIEVEGLDKSGKHTTCQALKKALEDKGFEVVQSEFHRYDTPTGKLIQQWLYKQYDVDTETIKLIMTADKQAQQKWFSQLEEQGVDFLILDRYSVSNLAYSEAEGLDMDWITNLQKFLRKPDFSIFLDIQPTTSMLRKGKHGDNDRYESDKSILTRAREAYIKYFEEKPNTSILYHLDEHTPEDVSAKVIEKTFEHFKID